MGDPFRLLGMAFDDVFQMEKAFRVHKGKFNGGFYRIGADDAAMDVGLDRFSFAFRAEVESHPAELVLPEIAVRAAKHAFKTEIVAIYLNFLIIDGDNRLKLKFNPGALPAVLSHEQPSLKYSCRRGSVRLDDTAPRLLASYLLIGSHTGNLNLAANSVKVFVVPLRNMSPGFKAMHTSINQGAAELTAPGKNFLKKKLQVFP